MKKTVKKSCKDLLTNKKQAKHWVLKELNYICTRFG